MDAESCTCFWTDPATWTTHYSVVEPGSQREWNPDCPEHGLKAEERNRIAELIFADEQRCREAIYADPANPHLNGRLMGLQRARDIVTGDLDTDKKEDR